MDGKLQITIFRTFAKYRVTFHGKLIPHHDTKPYQLELKAFFTPQNLGTSLAVSEMTTIIKIRSAQGYDHKQQNSPRRLGHFDA
jgi:hypothetical protein